MRTYLYSEAGFIEKSQWMPNSWVNVECPDDNDFDFLTQELKVPESFLEDIADADERPRTETEGNWLLTILRIPMQSSQHGIPFITVPIGIITNNEIIVSVCYHKTELISDFIQHTRRKGIVVNNKLDLILRMIYSSAVWFLKYLKQINNDVANAEKTLLCLLLERNLNEFGSMGNSYENCNTHDTVQYIFSSHGVAQAYMHLKGIFRSRACQSATFPHTTQEILNHCFFLAIRN